MNTKIVTGGDTDRLLKRGFALALFTIGYNIIEGLVSVYFGAGDETLALAGFGVDSFVEVLSGIGVAHMIWRMRRSTIAERDRFERQALYVTGTAFYLLAAGLLAGAAYALYAGIAPETTIPGIIIAAISIAAMWLLIQAKVRVGRALGSEPILADAECTRTCFYLSILLLASSVLYEFLRIPYVDTAGALGIAWFAYREGREAFEKARSGSLSCSCGCSGEENISSIKTGGTMKPLKILGADLKAAPLSPLRQSSCCAPATCSCASETPAGSLHNDAALRGAHWIEGMIDTTAGKVPVVSTDWKAADHLGRIRARLSSFRMQYTVDPGPYAVGKPGPESDVFVSANYKLSFDVLRRALSGMNAWILVLDTKGINVWCAAGKGTFGTAELVRRIQGSGLSALVSHRRVVAPQLGAVGVDADAVKKETGFTVRFGPVRANDIPAYVRAGYKKTEAMRRVRFGLLDRIELTPMELRPAVKPYLIFAVAMLVVFGLAPEGILFKQAIKGALPFLVLGLAALLAGAFLTPLLLPFVPFRSFALKGLLVGAATVVPLVLFSGILTEADPALLAASYIFFPLASSYLALQFTGASTYTGIAGVKKELRYAIPVYIAGTAVSALALIVHKLIAWGIV